MGRIKKKHKTLAFILEHFEGFRHMIILMSVMSLLSAVAKVADPIMIQILVDNILSGLSPEWYDTFIIVSAGICLFSLAYIIPDYVLWKYNLSMNISSKSQYFWHALRLPVSFYSNKYAGDIAGRMNYSNQIEKSLKRIALLISDAFLIVVYLYFMIRYSVFLASFAIIHIAVSLLIVNKVHKKMVGVNKQLQKGQDLLVGYTSSVIKLVEAIKGSSGEKVFLKKWIGRFATMQNSAVECNETNFKMQSIPLLLESVLNVIVLGLGCMYIIKGYLTVGMLMTFQSFMSACMVPVTHFTEIEQTLTNIRVKTERMNEIFEQKCDVPGTLEPIDDVTESKLHGEVELRNISFGYDRSQPPIINNFNLHIKPGKSVAFVGGSGSGKSTLAKLISGLYRPWSGEVLFDGKTINEINREVFANSVSVVDQNIVLFDGKISENVKMWDESVEDFAMILACHNAQIHDDIVIRNGAYDSGVESGGKNFSGGQRQRIELATAFAKEPSIMIMDEGTSALDAVTEDAVMRNLKNLGCSLIIIAHRLSTIRDCDEIIVLNHGVVEERGTHEELMKNKGFYSRLVEN